MPASHASTPPAPVFDDPGWGGSFERSQIILRGGGVEIRIVEAGEERRG